MTREGNSGRCTRCGAEGVNRRSCTGDAETHAELSKGYTGPQLGTGNGSGPTRFEKEYDEVDEVVENLIVEEEEDDHVPDIPFEVSYTPPAPARPGVFIVTLRVITRMPAGTEQLLTDFIHDVADVIHLDTDFEELRYD